VGMQSVCQSNKKVRKINMMPEESVHFFRRASKCKRAEGKVHVCQRQVHVSPSKTAKDLQALTMSVSKHINCKYKLVFQNILCGYPNTLLLEFGQFNMKEAL